LQSSSVPPARWMWRPHHGRHRWKTRQAIGGCGFIPVTDDQAVDEEIYVDVHLRTGQLTSPDARLDDILDFIAHAATDIPRLTAEIRRMHGQRRNIRVCRAALSIGAPDTRRSGARWP
jgi:hypothetical protein